ncbi:MAG: ATP-binding protein [Paracoccaceae bacterium]
MASADDGNSLARRAPAIFGASIAGFLALGFALMATGASTSRVSGFYEALGGLVAVAAAALAVFALVFARRAGAAEAAFVALHRHGAAPSVLSDADGRLICCNAAFPAAARRGGVGAAIGALLGDAAAGEAAAYRLANAARRQGAAQEHWLAVSREGKTGTLSIRAERLGPEGGPTHLFWSMTEDASPPSAGHEGASYAFARRARSGHLLRANQAFEALDEAGRASALGALETARAAGRAYAPLCSGAMAISSPAPGGAEDILILPSPPPPERFFEAAPVALARLSAAGRIEAVNPAALALLGPDARPGAAFGDLVEGLGRPIAARIAEATAGKGAGRADLARSVRGGGDLYLQIAMRRMAQPADSGAASVIAVITDATEMEARERQFVQSQKMQAVGQLAGGVAHDFNNLLTAILGHCDLLTMRRDASDPDFDDLTQIRQNANRAAALVRQLLAFSRQQKLDPQACALGDVLGELSHLLDRLIGARVSLRVETEPGLWPVSVDVRQFEQVILNLVVNARDAMPEGGEVSIICRNETLHDEWRRDRAVAPVGDYVRIEIADQGAGMTEETRAKVFEPFFTTKRQGEGTGLGLSTAYGIVKQTGGFIFVDSAPGKGAVFTILVPRRMESAAAAAPPKRAGPARDQTGAGRILLVEDEAPVRGFASRALKLRGYEVIEAEHAEAALAILEDEALQIDLVVSDVVMPGLDGPTWVGEARKKRPNLSVVFTSGYSEDMFRRGLAGRENSSFLAKPFSLEELSAAVKARLSPSEVA